MAALECGDYAIALKEFKPLAEQGHADAQNNLGVMYANGFGATQDFARAYMWWNIAASKGNELAVLGLTAVQKDMSPSQIKKAQKLTNECVAKNYKGC